MIARPSPSAPGDQRQLVVWWLVLAGLACMYLPVYWEAAHGIWKSDDHAHGVIVLAVVLWLFWTLKKDILISEIETWPIVGWTLFVLGLCTYVLGRIVNITIFEFGSQPMVISGLLFLMGGLRFIRITWFPIFYLIFMIPLPGIFVDGVTGPLKSWISNIVVNVLYFAEYPVAHSGVTITVGQYQMLVADACSGLHSMFSLTALGTLFIFIVSRGGFLQKFLMLASILPIAFVANVIRVLLLVLITYHFGDSAGQGFLHGLAGMVLMMIALLTLFAWDQILTYFFHDKNLR